MRADIRALLLSIILLVPFVEMAAQKTFTLEDLNFGGVNHSRFVPQSLWTEWWGDRLMYQDADEGGTLDNKGNRTTLFTLADLGEGWHSVFDAIYPYPDKTQVLLDNGKQRVLYDWKTKKIVWQQTSEGERFSDFNVVSKCVAYVKNNQLFVRDAYDKDRQLTTDGSREIVYGQSVHRNEFGISKGTFWSSNGKKLAFYRMDQSMVKDYPQVNVFAREAEYEADKYPMAGDTSHRVTVGVYDVESDRTIFLKTPAYPDDDGINSSVPVYFTNIAWNPAGTIIYIFELNRDQNMCQLVSYDAVTGERIAVVYEEKDDMYVEPMNPILFLPWDDNLFIVQSQRSGFNHLYLYSVEGGKVRQLTQGTFVVLRLVGFNSKDKSVIVETNELSPIQKNIYSVDIKTGTRSLLDNGRGYHKARLSATGRKLVDAYSEPEVPRNYDLVEMSGSKHSVHCLFQSPDPWLGYCVPTFEVGTLKAADGVTDLYYRITKPHDFDPSRKYPAVVYVYGGPHAHLVDASWHYASRSWDTYMAQKGYIVFSLDNRGSEHRGKTFEQVTFRQLGQTEMLDQMKGVEYLLSQTYIDKERIGVHGWSFGGFMTISLITNYPDVFKVAVAGGPVIDWKWYEVMYGERYMDTPQQNPEGYARTSLLSKAKDLKGRLQIVTGYNDNTVVPQHCLSFLEECIKAGTQPDFFVYPGEEHNMKGHKSVHLHERITRYFDDYLK